MQEFKERGENSSVVINYAPFYFTAKMLSRKGCLFDPLQSKKRIILFMSSILPLKIAYTANKRKATAAEQKRIGTGF